MWKTFHKFANMSTKRTRKVFSESFKKQKVELIESGKLTTGSVATQFDNAELDYEVVLNSDFTVKSRLVHIKKQIGEVRDDIELRYGENIKTVKRSINIDNLYTAIRPISKDGNDKITTIASYPDWQKLDENGNVK